MNISLLLSQASGLRFPLGLCLILALSLFACQESKAPEDVLSESQMVNMLIDFHLAEAQITEERFRHPDSAKRYYKILEKEIFEKYQVDSSQYARSYDFYAKELNPARDIYAQVVDSLTFRESMLSPDSSKKKKPNKPKTQPKKKP